MTGSENNPSKINTLFNTINQIIEEARNTVYRTANFTMVQAYWNIGKTIVEEEQNGKERAEYGQELIKQLSKKLTKKHGKGFHLLSSSYLGQSKDSLAAFFAGKALEVNPNNYIALTNMGILYDRKSEYEKATVFYEKSLKINDTLFQTYSNYLVNRIKVGDFTNAVKMGEKALEFGNHIWDKAHLCLSYHKVGDIEKRDSLLNTLKRLKFEKLTNLEVKIYEDIE